MAKIGSSSAATVQAAFGISVEFWRPWDIAAPVVTAMAFLLAAALVLPLATWIDLYDDHIEFKKTLQRPKSIPLADIDKVWCGRYGLYFQQPGIWGVSVNGPSLIGAVGIWPERIERQLRGRRIAAEIQAAAESARSVKAE